jgi:AcrR family transcriptional regulator
MVARAEAVAATRERIIDAGVELFWERPSDQISLAAVARRAGVTVQTVIRRFGGKEGLIAAGQERERAKWSAQRDQAPVGDVARAVRVLVEHYEAIGDRVLKLLAEEDRIPALREYADYGRAFHHDWCARVFAPALGACGKRSAVARERLFAQLMAICDVYMWKLLRRDAALSRNQTELALLEMLEPLLEEDPKEDQ